MSQYNTNKLSGRIRRRLHVMRFEWLQRHIVESDNSYSLFELGCFDCRSLSFLPKPSHYVGADANWEGGLDEARMYYSFTPGIDLVKTLSARDLEPYKNARFDYSVCLETLQYIPEGMIEEYIAFLARVTKKKLFISVPVEIGPVFLAKYVAKILFHEPENEDAPTYRLQELFWATMGRTEHVQRFQHKGFDYRKLSLLLGKYFTLTSVEGIPLRPLPLWSFQVGIVAEPKL